jgi:hypothetical protein
MRPSGTVARAALTAVLALGALPGLVGSREPSQAQELEAAAFGQLDLATTRDRQAGGLQPDAAGRSDGVLDASEPFADPVAGRTGLVAERAVPAIQASRPSWSWKPPRSVITGEASFYDHGTTAMRLPRGTVIVICGAGGCIERTVTDYGPSKAGGRVIDLYRPDFFAICGCGWWSGTTQVTVRVY